MKSLPMTLPKVVSKWSIAAFALYYYNLHKDYGRRYYLHTYSLLELHNKVDLHGRKEAHVEAVYCSLGRNRHYSLVVEVVFEFLAKIYFYKKIRLL
jgi:hypothetical protein